MHCQHVNLGRTHEAVDDTIGPVHDLPNQRILELRNGSA